MAKSEGGSPEQLLENKDDSIAATDPSAPETRTQEEDSVKGIESHQQRSVSNGPGNIENLETDRSQGVEQMPGAGLPSFNPPVQATEDTMEKTSLGQDGIAHHADDQDVDIDDVRGEIDAVTDADKALSHEGEAMDDSRSEIQSIMEQFEDEDHALGEREIMSPRLERASQTFGSPGPHPHRDSSLDATANSKQPAESDESSLHNSSTFEGRPPRTSSLVSMTSLNSLRAGHKSQDSGEAPLTPQISRAVPPPPQPDPESDLPFDFHRFLEQLRHRTADPVAKYLRSFLLEFAKRQWLVHEQVKLISDFLEFISKKMAQCEVWRNVSDAEFDNAREGMEKLVMNRLYNQTFSPAIAAPEPSAGPKGKRRAGNTPLSPSKPGRQGQHQEDVERDEVLAQKVRIYGWVKEEHLDIKPIGDKGRKFMNLAQQELLKIRSYRAPRDKVICVLNSCKVIFGFLRNSQHDQSADSFIPLLIYVVLKANPDHLVSNVQYILRFRNQDKLGGEAGYYISSLMGAIQFIEGLDRTSLTISDEDFERYVEAAVSTFAEPHPEEPAPPQLPSRHTTNQLSVSEKSTLSRPEVTPRHSTEPEQVSPRKSQAQRKGLLNDDEFDDNVAAGLLRSIQKPLSTIGRMFSDDNTTSTEKASLQPPLTPQPGSSDISLSTTPREGSAFPADAAARKEQQKRVQQHGAEDAAARQASVEAEEARKLRRREERTVVETLCGMFPNLDKEVIKDVVRANEGRVGSAVDACLALHT